MELVRMYALTSEVSSITKPYSFSITASIPLFLEPHSFTTHKLRSSTTTMGISMQGFSVRTGRRLRRFGYAFHKARQAKDRTLSVTMKAVGTATQTWRETSSWYAL